MDECNTQEELLSVKFIGGGGGGMEELKVVDMLPSCGERRIGSSVTFLSGQIHFQRSSI